MHSTLIQLTWIFCPGHDGVKGIEQADRLVGEASTQGVLRWDKSDFLMAVTAISNREETLACEYDQHIIRQRTRSLTRRGDDKHVKRKTPNS
jgi:hypothetical protein